MTFRKVLASNKLHRNAIMKARVGTRVVALVRQGDSVIAFKNACPHAGSPLHAGTFKDGVVTCERHGWQFLVGSGACPQHPIYSLTKYETKEEDGWIYVDEATDEIW